MVKICECRGLPTVYPALAGWPPRDDMPKDRHKLRSSPTGLVLRRWQKIRILTMSEEGKL